VKRRRRRGPTSTAHRTPEGLRALLTEYRGDVLNAARSIGMTRQGLWLWVARFDLYGHIDRERARRPPRPPPPPRLREVRVDLFGVELDAHGEPGATRAETLRTLIIQHGGSPNEILRVLGVNRSTLLGWMVRFDLLEFAARVRRELKATYRL
jgi:transcriptional regulator of acetoin/glycerol metabolism